MLEILSPDCALFRVILVTVVDVIQSECKEKGVQERVKNKTIVCGSALLTNEPTSTGVSDVTPWISKNREKPVILFGIHGDRNG